MAKYNNTKYKGYDSIREYRRAQELKLLEKKGIISGLQEQCKYELIPAQYEYYEGNPEDAAEKKAIGEVPVLLCRLRLLS